MCFIFRNKERVPLFREYKVLLRFQKDHLHNRLYMFSLQVAPLFVYHFLRWTFSSQTALWGDRIKHYFCGTHLQMSGFIYWGQWRNQRGLISKTAELLSRLSAPVSMMAKQRGRCCFARRGWDEVNTSFNADNTMLLQSFLLTHL